MRLNRETKENIEASLYFAVVFVLCVLVVLICAGRSQGANCGACAVKQRQVAVKQHVVAQPVAVAYPVQYFVGAELRQQSVIRHEVREAVREALAELQVGQLNRCDTCDDDNSSSAPASPSVFSQKESILASSCVRCHSGEEPKSGLSLDVELNHESRAKIAEAVIQNKMPLGADGEPKPLSDEAKMRLLLELFGSSE